MSQPTGDTFPAYSFPLYTFPTFTWPGIIGFDHAEVFRANVILNRSISRATVLNQAVQEDVILNRSVPSTYEELEEV